MSVYGGFCTRKQEKDYNACLSRMLVILAKRVVKAVHNSSWGVWDFQERLLVPVDAGRFAAYFGKVFGMMVKLEEGKYQPPKLSESLWELADALGINQLSEAPMESSKFFQQSKMLMQRVGQFSQGKRQAETESNRQLMIDVLICQIEEVDQQVLRVLQQRLVLGEQFRWRVQIFICKSGKVSYILQQAGQPPVVSNTLQYPSRKQEQVGLVKPIQRNGGATVQALQLGWPVGVRSGREPATMVPYTEKREEDFDVQQVVVSQAGSICDVISKKKDAFLQQGGSLQLKEQQFLRQFGDEFE